MNKLTPAIVRPSGSHEWSFCGGSQFMQKDQPNDDSDATREGTAAHWVGSEILLSYITPDVELKTSLDFKDQLAPNDVFIDEEMIQGAVDYVTDVLQYCNETGSMRMLHVEEKLNIDSIYPGMLGTPDCWVYNATGAELVVWDFKYGYGHVEAFENPQLMIYVAGILELLGIDGLSSQWLTIKMRIFQPRSYHGKGPIREWKVKASDLRGYFNQLRTAAALAMSGEGKCTPGLHCKHCARHICPALQGTNYNVIDVISNALPVELTGNNLALELKLLRRASKLVEFRLSAIESQVENVLSSGKILPGFMLEKKYGNKRWKKNTPIADVLAFTDAFGIDIRKPDNLDTPTQAIAKVKKTAKEMGITLDASVINNYTEIPYKGLKVVESDVDEFFRQSFGKG